MTPFLQRPGLCAAQEQVLQNPLAWSPLPIAALSQGPDRGISLQAHTIGYTGLQQPRQSPEKDNSPVNHELPSCPSHTKMQRGHPTLLRGAPREEEASRNAAAVYTAHPHKEQVQSGSVC